MYIKAGVPWNDPSGDRLRQWINLDKKTFYDFQQIAIIPIGFCYPGTGPSGDLPPRKECSTYWLPALLAGLPNLQLTLLLGQYAQRQYLGKRAKKNLPQRLLPFQIICQTTSHCPIHRHAARRLFFNISTAGAQWLVSPKNYPQEVD